jgi:hypothetical protein
MGSQRFPREVEVAKPEVALRALELIEGALPGLFKYLHGLSLLYVRMLHSTGLVVFDHFRF